MKLLVFSRSSKDYVTCMFNVIILIYTLLSFNLIQVLYNWFKHSNTWNVEYIVENRFSKEMFIIFFFLVSYPSLPWAFY